MPGLAGHKVTGELGWEALVVPKAGADADDASLSVTKWHEGSKVNLKITLLQRQSDDRSKRLYKVE